MTKRTCGSECDYKCDMESDKGRDKGDSVTKRTVWPNLSLTRKTV